VALVRGTVAERGTNDHLTVPINSAELARALQLNLADCADHAAELRAAAAVYTVGTETADDKHVQLTPCQLRRCHAVIVARGTRERAQNVNKSQFMTSTVIKQQKIMKFMGEDAI